MSENIISKLPRKLHFRSLTATTEQEIVFAEQKLNTSFSNDYKEYVSAFGAASFYGHELTGICSSSRLNVVDVTISERELNPLVPMDLYVVEQANIDGIVVWQSSTGEIYQSTPNTSPVKICESLCEYIDL